MASNGIRDRSPSWGWAARSSVSTGTARPTTCWSTPPEQCLGRHAGDHAGGRRRLLAGHDGLGPVGPDAERAAAAGLQAGHPGGELLRHGLGGGAQRLLRGRLRRLRPGDGGRRGEAQGLRLLGPGARRPGRRRDRAGHHRAGCLLPAGPGLLRQARRGRRRHAGGDDPRGVEEPRQRRAQPAGAVPPRGAQGEDRRRAAGRRAPGGLRLLGSVRRRRVRADRAGRGRSRVHRPADVRQGAVVCGRPGQRPGGPGLRLHDLPRGGRAVPATPTPRPGSPTRAARSRWPRCTTASPPPSWC